MRARSRHGRDKKGGRKKVLTNESTGKSKTELDAAQRNYER